MVCPSGNLKFAIDVEQVSEILRVASKEVVGAPSFVGQFFGLERDSVEELVANAAAEFDAVEPIVHTVDGNCCERAWLKAEKCANSIAGTSILLEAVC